MTQAGDGVWSQSFPRGTGWNHAEEQGSVSHTATQDVKEMDGKEEETSFQVTWETIQLPALGEWRGCSEGLGHQEKMPKEI